MKRKLKTALMVVLSCLLLVCASFVFTSCVKPNNGSVQPSDPGQTEEYTISFDCMGGDSVGSIKYSTGAAVVLPKPNYDEYIFRGWYDDTEWTKQYESGIINNSSDIALYARWGVSVSFDTDGGDSLQPVVVDKGKTVDVLPSVVKSGYAFSGWYTDGERTSSFNMEETLDANTILFAKFVKNTNKTLIKMQSLDNVCENPQIIVQSSVELHDENIDNYFSVTNTYGELFDIVVSEGNKKGNYIISSLNSYESGLTYVAKILDSAVKFEKVGGNEVDFDTTQVSFTIYKETYNNITEVERKHIQVCNIYNYSPNMYTYQSQNKYSPDEGKQVSSFYVLNILQDYQKGDIISIGEREEETNEDEYYKIVEATKRDIENGGENVSYWYIEFIAPEIEDIYSTFDSYTTSEVDLSEYIGADTKNAVLLSIEKSEGLKKLSSTLGCAVAAAPTVQSAIAKLDEDAQSETIEQIQTMALSSPSISFIVNGNDVTLSVEFEKEFTVANICKITINVSLADKLSLTVNSYTKWVEKYYIGFIPKYFIQATANVANELTFSFSAEVEFSGTGEKQEKIDIGEEVMKFVKDTSSDINDFAEDLTGDPLYSAKDDDLDYVDIFNCPLGDIPIPITNILTFSIELEAVVSLGGKAGVYVTLSQQFAEQINIANGTINSDGSISFYDDGFNATSTQLKSDLNLDITFKGKVGIRCGLELKLKMSVLHLNSLAAVYVSATYGPYVELTGMAVFNYNYDALRNESTTEVYGGMYLDVGVFVDLKFGIDTVIFESDTSIYTYKYKLFTYGSTKALVRFSPNRKTDAGIEIVDSVYTRSFYYGPWFDSAKLDVLDLTTGQIITGVNCYNVKMTYTVNPRYSNLVSVNENGLITISDVFKGTYLVFSIHVKVVDENAIIGKTVEKDVTLWYSDPNANSNISTKNHLFVNYYIDNTGFHRTFISQDYSNHVYVGFPVISPIRSESDLPTRTGYYLDMDDLWLRYVGGNDLDESWDGTLGVCSIDDPDYVEYRLNWKVISLSANYYDKNPGGDENETYSLVGSTDKVYMYFPYGANYVEFLLPSNTPSATQAYGYNFNGYSMPNFKYYNFNYTDSYYGISNGRYICYYNKDITSIEDAYSFYLENGFNLYTDYIEQTYTVTWKAFEWYSSQTDKYRVLDYPKGTDIKLKVPEKYTLGTSVSGWFFGSQTNRIIDYYTDASGNKYETLDKVIVNKNISYNVYATTSIHTLTYKLVDKSDLRICTYLKSQIVAEGQAIPAYDMNELTQLAASSFARYNLSSYSLIAPIIPDTMPTNDLTIEIDFTYEFNYSTVVFDAGADNTLADGTASVTYKGDYYSRVEDVLKKYTAPSLAVNNFYRVDGGKLYYYEFAYWASEDNVYKTWAGAENLFLNDITYKPNYKITEKQFKIAFKSVNSGGYEFYYSFFEDAVYGKTLSEVLTEYSIEDPVRGDYSQRTSYKFVSWDKPNDYVFGSETDINGEYKTDIVINAIFSAEKRIYTITLDADEGKFSDGTTQKVVSGSLDDITDFSSYVPTRETDENYNYKFIGWSKIHDDNYGIFTEIDGVPFKPENITYYAVYKNTKLPRTITINAGEVLGENGGKAYFNDRKTQITSVCYDGEVYSVNTQELQIDNSSYTAEALYIICKNGNDSLISYFNEYGFASFIVDGNAEYTVCYGEPELREYYVIFETDSLADKKGESIKISNGYMKGFVHYTRNDYTIGSTLVVPEVYYYANDGFEFAGWKVAAYNKDGYPITDENGIIYTDIAAGETFIISGNCQFTAKYVYNEKTAYFVRFYAAPYYTEYGEMFGSEDIIGTAMFEDGSIMAVRSGIVGSAVVFDSIPKLGGFKFLSWVDDNGNEIHDLGTFKANGYSSYTDYYAKYERADDYVITLNAAAGQFADGKSVKTLSAPYGKVCSALEEPISNDSGLAFSYYADNDGNIVNVIEKNVALTAMYAIPICTFEDLKQIENNPSGAFVLKKSLIETKYADRVDTSDNVYVGSANVSSLCINKTYGFSGMFNGNGNTILCDIQAEKQYVGLFAKVSGKIMNLSVTGNVYVTSEDGNESVAKYVGSIAGTILNGGVIENCFVGGVMVIRAKVVSGFSSGIIVGENNGTIKDCSVIAKNRIQTSIESNGTAYVGAVAGVNNGLIDQVVFEFYGYELGIANSLKLYYGLFAGYNRGNIYNSIARGGDLSLIFLNGDNDYLGSKFYISGLCGYDEGKVENCYYSYGFYYTILGITLFYDGGYEKINVDYYAAAPERNSPEMMRFLRFGEDSYVYNLIINDNDECQYDNEIHLSDYIDKAKIKTFMNLIDAIKANDISKTYSDCYNISEYNYSNFAIVSSMKINVANYGWLKYVQSHAKGTMIIG